MFVSDVHIVNIPAYVQREDFHSLEDVSIDSANPGIQDLQQLSVSSSESTDVTGNTLAVKTINEPKPSSTDQKDNKSKTSKKGKKKKCTKSQNIKNQRSSESELRVRLGSCVALSVVISVVLPLFIFILERREEVTTAYQNTKEKIIGNPTINPPLDGNPPEEKNILPSEKTFMQLDREEMIRKIIVPRYSSETSINTQDSPQYLALKWLAHDDKMQVSVYDGDHLLQRYALAVLYHSTRGKGWWNQLGFLSPLHECQWKKHFREMEIVTSSPNASYKGDGGGFQTPTGDGVSCDSSQFVTNLQLAENGLQGHIPPEVKHLTHLTRLSLQNNYLVGTVPQFISSIPKLQRVYLQRNHLEGSVEGLCERLASITPSSGITVMQVDLKQMDCSCCMCCA